MRSSKHLCTFPIDSGNQEKQKVLSVEIEVRFLVIYFLLLLRRQTNISSTNISCEFEASITNLSNSFKVFNVVLSLEMLAKSIRCHLS